MVSQYLTGKVNKEAVVDYTYYPRIFLVGPKTFTKFAPEVSNTAEFEQNTISLLRRPPFICNL
jgi:hypothetical protein